MLSQEGFFFLIQGEMFLFRAIGKAIEYVTLKMVLLNIYFDSTESLLKHLSNTYKINLSSSYIILVGIIHPSTFK